MKTKNIILLLIILFACFIRLYKIDQLPPSLYYDEIDAGYQAQTFNKNHTDYYGNKFPIHFHSFGDFRTSLYVYSIALVQKIIPNPDLSVRLPAAIFGIASVFVIYLITRSLIPSFLLAISPWAIHYSRIGFEASGMLLFILLGIYFWQRFLKKQSLLNIYLSVLFFCLSPYFYSTAKLFLVFIVIVLFIIGRRQILSLKFKKIAILFLFSLILMLPMLSDTLNGKAGFRFQYISIFTMPHREQVVDTLRFEDAVGNNPGQLGAHTSLISSLYHNKYQLVLARFVQNYVSSFSTTFLFIKGDDNPRQGFGGGYGLNYLLDAVFILLGLFYAFSKKKKDNLSVLFFWFLVLAPIPFALTRDVDNPHATRLILMLPSLIYFTYLGIKYVIQKFPWSTALIIILYAFFFLNFWHFYYYHYPQQSAMSWNTGMKETVIAANDYSKSTLVFSDSYISFVSFFLYYHPYNLPPQNSIQTHLINSSNNSFAGQVLDNQYYFGTINWSNLSQFPQNTIYILPKSEYTAKSLSGFKILKSIPKKYTNQEEFYLITQNSN
jgi:hypothetical protein